MTDELFEWVILAKQVEIHKAGNAQGLIDWYNEGANGQIDWGSEGDFQQCVDIAGEYLDNPEGFCQLRHIDATGEPSGHAAGEIEKADDTYVPPQAVQAASQRALEWIADGKAGDGFTDVGRKRASDIAHGHGVSLDTVKRMKAYFDRHAVDKDAPGFTKGDETYPSPGRVAWDAWGGEAGYSWAKGIIDKMVEKAGETDKPDYQSIISDKKGEPVDDDLYRQVIADAKEKFDVYPSAVSSGWVVQEYKRRGGKYRVPVEKGDLLGHIFHGNQHQAGEGGGAEVKAPRRIDTSRFQTIGRYGTQAKTMLQKPDAPTHRAFVDAHAKSASALRKMAEDERGIRKPDEEKIKALENAAQHHDFAASQHEDAAGQHESENPNAQLATNAAIAMSNAADGATETAIQSYGFRSAA